FHGGHPEARIFRLDLLLAGDQRDGIHARAIDALVVDLARQQPQRQPDDAGGMRQHPLDRQMGLAGVGRPEHGGDAGAGGPFIAERSRRESHILQVFLTSRAIWRALSRVSHYATLARRGLSSGTSLERIASESRPPSETGFVHRNISRGLTEAALDRVFGSSTSDCFLTNSLKFGR